MFAAYASPNGDTRLDRRLYLPDAWCEAAHRTRWHTCGVPEATLFKTKPTLALERLRAVVQAGTVRCRWVTCDEAVGREPTVLDGMAALPRWYVAEMPQDTWLWLRRPPTAPRGPPAPRRADAATGRSTCRSAAPRGVAPIPAQRGQYRASGGRVRVPTRGGGTRGVARLRRVDRLSAGRGRAAGAQGLTQPCASPHASSRAGQGGRHAVAHRNSLRGEQRGPGLGP